MTNTTTAYISNFEKVAALVAVEEAGFYTDEVTPAIRAGVDEGYLTSYHAGGCTAVRLTAAGRERLAGFRALFS